MLRRTGQTLIELIYTLLILGVLAGMATRSLTRTRDELSVRVAASQLAGELSRARTLGVLHGGAVTVVDVRRARLQTRTLTRDVLVPWIELGATQQVELQVASGADSVVLSFDAHGLGRLANASFELRRGHAHAGVVVSAYGRVRQW